MIRWARYAAWAAVGPVVWVLTDFVVTGHPFFSLQHTSGLAEELGRTKGLAEVPDSMRRFFLNLAKAPVLYAGVVGFLVALWLAPRRVVMPAALWVIGSGTFVLVGIAGLSVIDRYLLVPSLMVMVFAAVALGGWTMLRSDLLLRKVWAVAALAIIVYGVAFTATRVNFHHFDAELTLRGNSHRSLVELLDTPAVRAARRCGPVTTPNHKLVPDTRWILGAGGPRGRRPGRRPAGAAQAARRVALRRRPRRAAAPGAGRRHRRPVRQRPAARLPPAAVHRLLSPRMTAVEEGAGAVAATRDPDDAPVTEEAARRAVRRAARRERLRWAPWVALLLAGSFALRVWGVKQGLPYAYNADENAHFVPKRDRAFGHGWNPHYFVNPPALHVPAAPRVRRAGSAGARASRTPSRPTRREVFVVARVTVAMLGTLAVVAAVPRGRAPVRPARRRCSRRRCSAVAFLPVFYSHLALNDVPTLAPICLALWGTAGVAAQRAAAATTRSRAPGSAWRCATKYTGGIVLLPLLARGRGAVRRAGRPRARPLGGARARRPCVAVAASSRRQPLRVLDYAAFHDGLKHQSTAADDALGKLGLTQRQRDGLLPVDVHLGARLGAAPRRGRGRGRARLRATGALPLVLAARAGALPALHGHPGALLRALADAGLPDRLPARRLRRRAGARVLGARRPVLRPTLLARRRGAVRPGARLACTTASCSRARTRATWRATGWSPTSRRDEDRRRAGGARRLGAGHRPPVAG